MGVERAGRTTATSPSSSSSSPPAAWSPSPGAAAGTACGTWPSGSTRPACRSSRRTRPAGSATRSGCDPSASPGPSSSATPAYRPRSRAHPGRGASTRTPRPRASPAAPPLLSPFDRLIHNRARAVDLFDFEYILEMYKPKAKRRWGYFALPVLHHDRLVGKIDAAADRKASKLLVHAIHQDVRFTRPIKAGGRRRAGCPRPLARARRGRGRLTGAPFSPGSPAGPRRRRRCRTTPRR